MGVYLMPQKEPGLLGKVIDSRTRAVNIQDELGAFCVTKKVLKKTPHKTQ